MFYQSPFAPLGSTTSSIPAGFNELTPALKQACDSNSFLYMVETKKLCLAVCAAEEVAAALRAAGQSFEPKKVFHQELQNQILSFALMSVLPDDVVKQCAHIASLTPATPSLSAAGRLAHQLEETAGESPEMVAAVQQTLAAQPLFRLASRQAEVFATLEKTYEQCAPYAAQLMATLKTSMGMLMSAAANVAASAPPAESAATAESAPAEASAPPTDATES